jgi:hypothetical protein
MPQTATVKSLPAAFRMMKAMQAEGVEWGEDYRQGARQAVVELLEGRMGALIEQHLERMAELGHADRRNGCYRRHLLSELGDLELAVPRTRTFSASPVKSGAVISAQTSSLRVSGARNRSRSPLGVTRSPRRSRSNNRRPKASYRFTCWFTAAWVRLSSRAALVIPRVSATACPEKGRVDVVRHCSFPA